VQLDRLPTPPYAIGERVKCLRATVANPPCAEAEQELAELRGTLERLEQRANRLKLQLAEEDKERLDDTRDELNDRLRRVTTHLIENLNYLDATAPEDGLPLHVFYDRDLRALDAALAHLAAEDAQMAIAALTDSKTGVHGAWCALDMSYLVYHRNTVGGRNPGRQDLFWGQDRTAELTDVWAELQSLQDKLERSATDLSAEGFALRAKREVVAAAYRDAMRKLTGVIDEAVHLMP
jgi:hypothetical protein